MKRFGGLAVAAGLVCAAAGVSAQPAGQQEDTQQGAMLLATLVGRSSPTLSAANKAVLARYLAGNAKADAKAGKITVDADQVICTGGDKDATSFACDLKFGASDVHLTARPASQLLAALVMVGDDLAAPIGQYSVSVSALHCTLDAATVAAGDSGGADCTFTPTTTQSAPPAPSGATPAPITVNDDSSLLAAALAGASSPTLSAADKAVLAHYLAGEPALDAKAAKFAVNADNIQCKSSNRSETTWSCDLTYGAKTVRLTGRAASELYAALNLTGLQGDAAMGTFMIGAKPLACTIDPAVIAARTGGGAVCTLTYGAP
jgi:hypothetical protein